MEDEFLNKKIDEVMQGLDGITRAIPRALSFYEA